MNRKEIIEICRIIIEAGKAILEIYKLEDYGVETKKDNSPLTVADTASNTIIITGLNKLEIDGKILPVLSEEGRNISFEERKNWKKYWLIDPLDGTKEFIKRNGEFTVNIALIENNVPIAGFVYVPVTDTLYFADKETGSYKQDKVSVVTGMDFLTNAEKLEFVIKNTNTIKVIASRSHLNKETEEFIKKLEKQYKTVEIVSSGSSIKLCMVADGSAHVYPRFAPTMEWDTAAAHAVCRYAGVELMDYKTKKELKYNKENLLNNWFLVTGNKIFKEI